MLFPVAGRAPGKSTCKIYLWDIKFTSAPSQIYSREQTLYPTNEFLTFSPHKPGGWLLFSVTLWTRSAIFKTETVIIVYPSELLCKSLVPMLIRHS